MSYFPMIPPQPIQQYTPQLPSVLDTQANYIFSQSVESSAQIEKGQLLVRDKRATHKFEQKYVTFMHFLPWMHSNRILLNEFQLNPYWSALIELLGYFQYQDVNYVVASADAIHGQIKTKFLRQCIALKYLDFIEPVNANLKHQKTVFKRCLDKHKQMNCLFLDLPCVFNMALHLDDEAQLSKIARKWLERLHQSEVLASKLYDVQWRIVKSLNGFYAVHAIIYVIGEETQYSEFILQQWKGTCLALGYDCRKGSQYLIEEKHCYFADSDMRGYWCKQIELLNEPLKIYRYVSQHISYLWQTYTGNIPAKRK